MMDTHDTNLPEKVAELEEDKKAAEVSERKTCRNHTEVKQGRNPHQIERNLCGGGKCRQARN